MSNEQEKARIPPSFQRNSVVSQVSNNAFENTQNLFSPFTERNEKNDVFDVETLSEDECQRNLMPLISKNHLLKSSLEWPSTAKHNRHRNRKIDQEPMIRIETLPSDYKTSSRDDKNKDIPTFAKFTANQGGP